MIPRPFRNVRPCLYAMLAVLFAMAEITAIPAARAEQFERWELEVLINLQGLQINRQCVPNGGPQHIHILGVSADDTLLDDQTRTAILSDLSELIATRTNSRTTKADNFQSIASSFSGIRESDSREIGALIDSASNADITVLVRPFRDNGNNVDAEIRLWARGAGDKGAGLNCVQSFTVQIPTRKEDPACIAAFAKARQDNDVNRLQAFRDFFPQCPQAAEADQLVTVLKAQQAERADRERCERNFARARAEGTVSAYSTYLDENIDCPGRDVVMALRDQAASKERCETAYRDTRRLDTTDAYEKFLLENRACPQADTASAFLSMKRQAAEIEEAKAETPAQIPVQPQFQAPSQPPASLQQAPGYDYQQPAQPRLQSPGYSDPGQYNTATFRGYPIPPDLARTTCGQLWYKRNLIYHLAGYCFQTAKGQRYFGGSCSGGTPSGADKQEIDRILQMERQNGCR
ncbi:YARHG domain-containing protein [Aurantimonas sp. VKM B-3413]|uniref:YARHG domain-containing protein n=1 Tax=Aurantimonas sp. VKM B-3413 TaxID=2779401 RepID=UPI001E371543|nr:YARHG domain-containing protein [Aurantimonas sp. VKM B-3413]MCB8837683.1 YARHG domain-containing protein [Aurantimonas sp. VKM B-3413]